MKPKKAKARKPASCGSRFEALEWCCFEYAEDRRFANGTFQDIDAKEARRLARWLTQFADWAEGKK